MAISTGIVEWDASIALFALDGLTTRSVFAPSGKPPCFRENNLGNRGFLCS